MLQGKLSVDSGDGAPLGKPSRTEMGVAMVAHVQDEICGRGDIGTDHTEKAKERREEE